MKDNIQRVLKSGVVLVNLGELKHGQNEIVFRNIDEWGRGFDGIFLELPIDFQNAVDNYLKYGKFSPDLEALFRGSASEGNHVKETFRLVLNFARKRKIPMACVDSSKTKADDYAIKSSHGDYHYLRSDSRDGDMYFNIKTTLDKKGGRWFFLCGAAHLDYSFSLYGGRPSAGKRLKDDLNDKIFTILSYRIPEAQGLNFYLTSEMSANVKWPLPGELSRSFDAVIIHP